MIIHTLFIKCCTLVPKNSQLLYVLVNLARGGEFVYKDIATRVGSKEMYITKNKQVYTYSFSDKPLDKITADVERIYEIPDCAVVTEKTVKEYMLRDYTVDCVNNMAVSKHDAPFHLNYIILCHVLKLFGPKDVTIDRGRIINIENIDTCKFTVKNIQVRGDQRAQKVKRMDALWLKTSALFHEPRKT